MFFKGVFVILKHIFLMAEKHFIITTKTDAAAAAVEQLLAELQDSIEVQQAPAAADIELDEATLKLLDERLEQSKHEAGIPWEEVWEKYQKHKQQRDNSR